MLFNPVTLYAIIVNAKFHFSFFRFYYKDNVSQYNGETRLQQDHHNHPYIKIVFFQIIFSSHNNNNKNIHLRKT